ncbi:hypothetical protein HZB96_02835 [Candidatus Gottesmanbacteria bacterium]|nr:hypothetical protein [Candidatus Gottesmanbacteria bacterium]MBI5452861.1 hypothetical protein [Candidatus Gottesmanbacteria bacterium]
MKQKIVISNIRVPEDIWFQAKAMAVHSGMSMNEYINKLITISFVKQMLGTIEKKRQRKNKKREEFFQKILDVAKLPNRPMDASEEDKIIYGIEDG